MNKIVCGRMKQGKTTLAVKLARDHSPGVVVWDPRNMVEGILCWGPEDLEEAIETQRWKQGPLIYRHDSMDVNAEFSRMCEVLFPPMFTMGKFALVVDEAGQLQKPNSIHPSLDRAVKQHPRSVEIIQTAHSLQDWYRSSKDLFTDLYCFALVGRSLQAVVEFCDGDEVMEQTIKSLPDHHYVQWNHSTASYTICSNPESWHIPIFKQEIPNERMVQ